MTEAEWQACQYPLRLLEDYLRGKATERKLRLLACAACYQVWPLISDERSRNAVLVAEQYADGLADELRLEVASMDSQDALRPLITGEADNSRFNFFHASANVAEKDSFYAAYFALEGASMGMIKAEFRSQVQLPVLHDIFGNPFRPVTVDPSWLTPTVVTLANGIYADKAFDRMPILSDALEESGCENEDILLHCRTPGEHVRGCWVIDLLTGRK
jgi:hypothetical protein